MAENGPHFSQLESEDPNRLSGHPQCFCLGLLVSHGGTAAFEVSTSSCPTTLLPADIPFFISATFVTVPPELPILSPALTPQPSLKKQFWPRGIRLHVIAPGSSAGMSPLLPHPSAHSGRRQSSQQSVIASGRLQLILLEEFHQPPLPKLLRGSLVTSQIPPHTLLQSQTLQGWDTECEVVRTTQAATPRHRCYAASPVP